MPRLRKLSYSGKGDPTRVDALDREIAYTIFSSPNISSRLLAVKFKVSEVTIRQRTARDDFLAFQHQLELNIIEQALMARTMAMKNSLVYLKKPKSEHGFEMTKIFVKSIAEHPGTMPKAPDDGPEFFDPDEEKKRGK